ncbi:cache domain-containing protein [Desulforhopalus vacuolatus]|uniref:cache domain-containing protein n=1 Tax=Desulforhopalus vacuolatus TaxID=40414 RepID=UPI00196393BB|nr:cache domain-containing protein [Desulforhopalus vacuolatus]MBM9518480.1 cache domain-containing protein [Desulforhopalus vacuolatus]
MMRKKRSFYKLIQLWGIISLTALSIAIVGIDLVTIYHDFNIRIDNMRTDYIEQQKQTSKREVERIIDMINDERKQSESLARDKIKLRVYQAHTIAQNIYQRNKTTQSDAEIQQIIIEALRPLRFEHGNGYYFANSLDSFLFADKPENKGVNLLKIQDKYVRDVIKDTIETAVQSGEGFYEYNGAKPHSTGSTFKKIFFIKKFEPYDFFIGIGLSVEDIEEPIKADWMERINHIRYGKNKVGYLFAGSWHGKSLAHGAQPDLIGTDLWEWEDSRGNKTSQMTIAASKKKDGDYTTFWWRKPDTGEEQPKITYAKAVPGWELFIASGFYTDDIEQNITALRAALNAHTKTKILILVIIVAIAFSLFFILFNVLTNRLKRDLNMFVSFFNQAAFSNKKIDREAIYCMEFDQMAESANKMIADRKKTEEALTESEQLFRSTFEDLQLGVLVSAIDSSIVLSNPAACRILGPGVEQIAGKAITNPLCNFVRVDGSVLPSEELPMARVTATGKSISDQIIGIMKPGYTEPTWINANAVPIFSEENQLLRVIGNFMDITERLNLQAQLIQAQKMESVGRLAGGVAHDFNNMLSIIIGYGEMALEKVDGKNSLHGDITEILMAAKRSTNITRQLLAFARQQPIAPKVIDPNEIIENMLKMLRRLIGEDINLDWLPEAKVWPIKIDPSQIDQILANLCLNARDAVADVGKVTIETKNVTFDEEYCANHTNFVPGEYIMLAVSDDGSGIEPEIQNKIFEPFFTTKSMGKGTGLGLATVYGIVKQNNGFINIYSEPDKGTTIKVYLSRHTGQTVEIHREAEAALEIPLSHGETILLVEDNEPLLDLSKKMMEDLGYTVLATTASNNAVSLAQEYDGEINLLLTDVVMPEMNGLELSKQLQSLYPDMKILFMSGYAANIITNRGVLEAGSFFIPKPFSKKYLALKVREALDSPKT